ncbi:hypothetical protein E2542_SST30327 [Spatholobus suberectus]|nr:hypothetical protein E2542_SST30327 [Spatholobus suberectus]
MAKTRPGRKDLDSYTIRGTNKIVRGNPVTPTLFPFPLPSCVFIGKPSYPHTKLNSAGRERCIGKNSSLTLTSAGDCVLMRPSDTSKPPYVARVEKIEQDNRSNVKVRVRWYYRPEESIGGAGSSMGRRNCFSLTTTMCRAHTPLKGSVWCTRSRTTPSSRMWALRITIVDLSTRLPPGLSPLTVLLCIASVRCLITRTTSWYNVKGARIGTILLAWA